MSLAKLKSIESMYDLRGKVSLVTGSAGGMGRACAYRLANCKSHVVMVDSNLTKLKESALAIQNAINDSKVKIIPIHGSVGTAAEAKRIVNEVKKEFNAFDILVNNAGIFPMSPFLDVTEEEFTKVLDTNLKGLYFFAQEAAKAMKQYGKVNIGSIDGHHPTGNLTHYDASKGAVGMLTKSMAKELAQFGIRVNEVDPGGIATTGVEALRNAGQQEMLKQFTARIPFGRIGDPDEIATVVLSYCTDMTSYATGSKVVIDGGMLLT